MPLSSFDWKTVHNLTSDLTYPESQLSGVLKSVRKFKGPKIIIRAYHLDYTVKQFN